MLRLLLLFLMVLSVQAATPRTFASIGDPVYAAVGPVRALAASKTFREERELFSAFLEKAEAAERDGRWLDGHRMLPEAKGRSESYLKTLRRLQQHNAQIGVIVRDKTMEAIRTHQTATYDAIKKSGYLALIDDEEFRRAVRGFENRRKQELKRKQAQQAKQKADYLRSYDNLKGEWRGLAADGKSVLYRFTGKKTLVIVRQKGEQIQTLEGGWQAENEMLNIAVERITNQNADGIPHVRTTAIKLQMQIRAVGKKTMTLFDTRRRTELRLIR